MHSKEQVKIIYGLCVARAKLKKTLTYSEVLKRLGYELGVSGYAIRYGLELLLIACASEGLPALTSIVVNKSTGKPSESGHPLENWDNEINSVFAHKEWPDVDAIDWEYIWRHRKQLSDKYGTSGYWGN